MTPTPAVSAKEKAREAVERLANVQMNISLEEWAALSSTILAALSATEGEAEASEEQIARLIYPYGFKLLDRGDLLASSEASRIRQAHASAREIIALYASPPSAPAGVKVKPLEWEHVVIGDGTPLRQNSWQADWYVIVESPSGSFDLRNGAYAICTTLDEAKAAAQSDYESRIRSSLQPDTQAAPKVHHLGAALQMIADEHASVLTPRQIDALYQAAAKLWPSDTQAAAASAPAQEGRADG